MPGMDGYGMCSALKSDERFKDVPVIFLSSLSDTDDKVRAFSAGVVDYVTKPFQRQEVIARVETHLRLARLQSQLEERYEQLKDLEDMRDLLTPHDRTRSAFADHGYRDLAGAALDGHRPAR